MEYEVLKGTLFTLAPSCDWIEINNESYNIPAIVIYNYEPELLGLIDVKD